MFVRRTGLYGSDSGDKKSLLSVLTGKGCLLGVLDYLGPAAETDLVSVGRIGLFGSGLVDRQRVSAERVGLFGSSYWDKEGLLGVLDYLGPATETGLGHLG